MERHQLTITQFAFSRPSNATVKPKSMDSSSNKVHFTEGALAKKLKALDGKTKTTQSESNTTDAEYRQEVYLRQAVMSQALIHGASQMRG